MTPGVPDIFIAVPRREYHGMFLELKSLKGRASKEQLEMLTRLSNEGYFTAICNSLEEAIEYISYYLKEI